VKYLIDLGTDIHKKNRNGCSPLNNAREKIRNFIINYIEDLYIYTFAKAIDDKNIDAINDILIKSTNHKKEIILKLYNKNIYVSSNHKKEIVLKLYNKNLLTSESLQFIIDNYIDDITISSTLIKKLIKDNNLKLLEIIFKKFKFYNNKFILKLLYYYKSRKPVTTSELNQQISSEKYKIIFNEEILEYPEEKNDIWLKNTSLYVKSACLAGNVHIVKYLINHGVSINGTGCFDNTPLHYACKNSSNNNETIVKYLVDHGADINKVNWNEETPLFKACEIKNETIVKYLVEHGADVNKERKDGKTLLLKACENKDETIVKCLVEHGADVNKENKKGETPLLKACEIKDETIVKYLVEHGADVNNENKKGETPLLEACKIKNETVVKCLVEHGADVNNENKKGKTPLLEACRYGNEAIVKQLVEHGANINKKGEYFLDTPLHIASQRGVDENIVKYLFEQNANINIENKVGETPLFQA